MGSSAVAIALPPDRKGGSIQPYRRQVNARNLTTDVLKYAIWWNGWAWKPLYWPIHAQPFQPFHQIGEPH
jgi:hypothetical protein